MLTFAAELNIIYMNVDISMEKLLHLLSGMSLDSRKWLAEHLVEPWERENTTQHTSDEEFVREFLATPYDNPTTAEEAKKEIRDSHVYGTRKIKQLHDEK